MGWNPFIESSLAVQTNETTSNHSQITSTIMRISPTIETMKNKRLIVVLGMHRSGSSAITRGLEVLGVNLGSHLMSADVNNEKGYFENVELHQLNTRILGTIGHDWNSLSLVQNHDFQSDKFTPLKNQAIDILRSELEETEMLGIKDPRFCRLLPFWIDVFDELQLNVSYVIILRDPESIAASLFSRDSFPRVKSLYLWAEHMIPVFRETSGCTRCVVDYEQLVAHPKTVIEKLANDLDLQGQLDQQALQSYETEFIDASLNHHQWKPGQATGFTPQIIKQLSALLDDVSNQEISPDSPGFISEIDKIEEEYKDRTDVLSYINMLDSIVLGQHFKLADTDEQLGTLSIAHSKATDSLKSKKKIITTRNLQIKGFKATIAELDERLAKLRLSLSDRETEIESLELSVTDRDKKIESLERFMLDRDEKIELLESSLNVQDAKINDFANQIRSLEDQIESDVSDMEILAVQLDEIRSSLFWKLSFFSRKFWRFFELVFVPKRRRFQLIPLNELKRVRFLENSWMSTGEDPFFKLTTFSGNMPGGWIKIKTRIQADPSDHMLKLYLDYGMGFNEVNSLAIPVSMQGYVDEIIYLSEDLKAIRWDPVQHAGEFKQESIIFSNTSWLTRKLKMINRVLCVLLTVPAEMRKEKGLGWKIIISDLNHAYETTRSIIISKNEHK